MSRRQSYLFVPMLLLFSLIGTIPVLAHGDIVIPQVPDGRGGDGTVWSFKCDLVNLSPVERITRVTLLFFRQDGSPWTLATNQGTVNQITLDLGSFQTIRIETLGTSPNLTVGYAILRNAEGTTIFSEDFEVGVTVFYEIRRGGNVIDTVSVPTGQPTVVWVFPVTNDVPNELLTGFAIVNLANTPNNVSLKLWRATTPSSGNPTDGGTATFTLAAREQRAQFLPQLSFPSPPNTFKGMLLGTSEGPVAILALLQSPTPTGVQYATVVPTYADALRRNTYMYLRQGFPLDADIPISDFYGNSMDTTPWDALYTTVSATSRHLAPRSGAMFSVIGQRTDMQFDAINLGDLQAMSYTTNNIDLSNNSSNLMNGFTFAIKTGLGRFVKIRIGEVITRVDNRDLALEIFIYRQAGVAP